MHGRVFRFAGARRGADWDGSALKGQGQTGTEDDCYMNRDGGTMTECFPKL